MLKYYDVNEKNTIQVDFSKSGLGPTLFQNGHPITMVSNALSNAQISYVVIEKELLAICFGCQKFHDYIFGKNTLIETDHKPLIAIMNKPVYTLSSRMQRMRMQLQNYNLSFIYKRGTSMYFADALSRAHHDRAA